MAALLALDLDPDIVDQLAKILAEADPDLEFQHLSDGSWIARKAPSEGPRGGNSRSAKWRRTRQTATRDRPTNATNRDNGQPEMSGSAFDAARGYQTDAPKELGRSDPLPNATNRDATTRQRDNTIERDNATRDIEPLSDDQCASGKAGVTSVREALKQLGAK